MLPKILIFLYFLIIVTQQTNIQIYLFTVMFYKENITVKHILNKNTDSFESPIDMSYLAQKNQLSANGLT